MLTFVPSSSLETSVTTKTELDPREERVRSILRELGTQKAYAGLADQIDTVLTTTSNPATDFHKVEDFMGVLLGNPSELYIEKYLNVGDSKPQYNNA